MTIRHAVLLLALALPLSEAVAQKAVETDREGVLRIVPSTPLGRGVRLPDGPKLVPGIVKGTNAFRVEQKLEPLEVDATLAKSAQAFADWMAEHDLYGHTADEREPAERAKAGGYDYCLVLENIAYVFDPRGLTPAKGADRLVQGWIDSPGHRRNILDPDVTEFGVGVALSEKTNTFYGVQLFGRPMSERIEFTLVNNTELAVPYHLGPHEYTVKPRFTMTHTACRLLELKLDSAKTGLKIGTGERFAIESKEGQASLIRLRPEKE